MNVLITITVIVVILANYSFQHNVSLNCNLDFVCEISNIRNTPELIEMKEKILSGLHVNDDEMEINISKIISIKFTNSTFRELPKEFFNKSFFEKLNVINLSGVGLKKINLGEFSLLKQLNISNNQLSSVDISGDFKKATIDFINLQKNNWNCSYLSKLLETLSELSIEHTDESNYEVNGCNVQGIECFCSIENQIDTKLDEILEAFNEQDVYHDLISNSFKSVLQQIIDMDNVFNKTNLEMNKTLLSILQIGNTCNGIGESLQMLNEQEENIFLRGQISSNPEFEKDMILNINSTLHLLNNKRQNLRKPVDELALIVSQKLINVEIPVPKESKTDLLWLLIIMLLIVIAIVIVYFYFRAPINLLYSKCFDNLKL